MSNATSPFVSTAWLAERLNDPAVAIVDGSFYLPNSGRSAAAEYRERHLPGAVFFDIDEIADKSNPLPHMLPSPEQFAAQMGALGLGHDDTIVIYDASGLTGGARVWWSLRHYGARDVRLLDGGLQKWQAEGRPMASGSVTRAPRPFRADVRKPSQIFALDDVRRALDGAAQVVDARATGRFTGEAAEPRPGLASGHMPGALNVPAANLLRDGTLVPPDEIAALFRDAGVDVNGPVVTSCGSGVSAAVLSLALHVIGRPAIGLYDGSWTEWAGRRDTPIATGPAAPR